MNSIHYHSLSDKIDYYEGYRDYFMYAKLHLSMDVKESEAYADLLFELECREYNEFEHEYVDYLIMDLEGLTYYEYTYGFTDSHVKMLERKDRRARMLHKQGRIRTLPRKPKEKIYTRKTKSHLFRDAWGENTRFNVHSMKQPQMWDGSRVVNKQEAKLTRLR